MSFKEKQKKVDDWVSKYEKPYFSPLSILAQINEETGELARILNDTYGDRVSKPSDPKSGIEAEICDILFALICLANSHNIDLDKAWDKTIGKRCKRDENRYKKKITQNTDQTSSP